MVVDVVFEQLLQDEVGFAGGCYDADAAVGHAVVVVLVEFQSKGVALTLLRADEVGVEGVETMVVAYGGVEIGMVKHACKRLPQGVVCGQPLQCLGGGCEMAALQSVA